MSQSPDPTPPPFAFTQGVGTVFQFVGVGLFVISMFICCCTSLLSKDSATHSGLTTIGWHRATDAPDQPFYSAQRALTITLPASLTYGMALAALGLGLQAANRSTPIFAVLVNVLAVIFWIVHLVFFAPIRWVGMSILCFAMLVVAIGLLILSIGAVRDVQKCSTGFQPVP